MGFDTENVGYSDSQGAFTEAGEKEARKEFYRRNESDILEGLLKAASYKTDESETHPIEIARNGAVALSFRIHPLSEEDFIACRKRHTRYKKNRQAGGVKVADDIDTSAYRSSVIYEATVEEDRKRIWDNREAWSRLDVVSGYQLIEKVLKGGEKDAVYEKVEEISGYGSAEEVAKN